MRVCVSLQPERVVFNTRTHTHTHTHKRYRRRKPPSGISWAKATPTPRTRRNSASVVTARFTNWHFKLQRVSLRAKGPKMDFDVPQNGFGASKQGKHNDKRAVQKREPQLGTRNSTGTLKVWHARLLTLHNSAPGTWKLATPILGL